MNDSIKLQISLPSAIQSYFDQILMDFDREKVLQRLWQKDNTLWSESPLEISNRLDWLDLPTNMKPAISEIQAFAGGLSKAGFRYAVLLGMGGSSLAAEVFRNVFSVPEGLALYVLDTTDPDAILDLQSRINLQHTLFIVSTKSGTTIETLSVFWYFHRQLETSLPDSHAGQHFIAITDPGSQLAATAKELNFRKVFENNPNIGGRFSALSHFGLVPAALVGADIQKLLIHAEASLELNKGSLTAASSPAAKLAAALGAAERAGRDKLTLITSTDYHNFSDWIEQLVAESTGKSGKGILPVVGEQIPEDLTHFGYDRIFALHQIGDSPEMESLSGALSNLNHPVVRVQIKHAYDLGALMHTWEAATALTGRVLGIHPYDQPNVESAKKLARSSVSSFQDTGKLPERQFQPLAPDTIREFISHVPEGGYIALQAYLAPSDEISTHFQQFQTILRDYTGAAVTFGYGPRFLHSTGQLHKGGRDNGFFIQFVGYSKTKLPIPGSARQVDSGIDFETLKQAQAIGDAAALIQAGREVLTIGLEPPYSPKLADFLKGLSLD
jgi:glucose-6-phosphate isomerase